jgi:enediyne biosynthesis protein E4
VNKRLKRQINNHHAPSFFLILWVNKTIFSIIIANQLLILQNLLRTIFHMFLRRDHPVLLIGFFLLLASCNSANKRNVNKDTLFTLMPSSVTGIGFTNRVEDSREINIFNFHNFYNGGGVVMGDINNDGLADIFLTSSQEKNKLYLNKGSWKFEDITEKAGLQSAHQWHTGATMADINADGWLDIYVCNSGIANGDNRANELYINQQNGTFKEDAAWYGLDDKGESTQATFFDYDHDGDLDCFILNNSHRSIENFGYSGRLRNIRDSANGDRFYRNDSGKFTDVSAQAGIYGSEIGFGLGVTVGDLNNDGWEDMYVSNDFFERDYLYMNNQNGTFEEVINTAIGHMSNGSMGSDMADINNDGYLDVFTTEMLPEDDYRLKSTLKFDEYDIQNAKNLQDFHHQFTSNCLQLNNHDGTFSEIAQLSGVDATGWSWGALSFDFNNDGWKDILVCNGIRKDLTDQDFVDFFSSDEMRNQLRMGKFDFQDILKKMPSVPIPNYAFVNQKNLNFTNEAAALGLDAPGFSNGAAYADLDGDGDMDLVVNNINAEAFVYRNNASEQLKHHYVKIKLKGDSLNSFGYGARVSIFSKSSYQVLEQMPSRGFESSVEPVLHFGLGTDTAIDSVVVQWPGHKTQTIRNSGVDTTVVFVQQDAVKTAGPLNKKTEPLYENYSTTHITGNIRHRENEFADFDAERLIPKMLSTEGPKLAAGDVNGDGLEDFYLGSAMADTAKLFIQQPDGKFMQREQLVFVTDKYHEDTGAEFFDADNDGDLDLIVASGGNQAKQGSPYLTTRLYINDGRANFSRIVEGFPSISTNASCVRAGDFNGDGKVDVFIGSRSVPGNYGEVPSSYLLLNEGHGKFTNITASAAPDLQTLGMVTDARWADLDKDGRNELVAVGDWMAITIMKFDHGKLKKVTEIPHSTGWWNCVTVADIDEDGDLDVAAGNNGLNSRIRASTKHPAKLYINDFDKNGQKECVLTYFKADGKAYPYFLKGEIQMQIPQLKTKFLRFADYAGKTINEVFTEEQLQHASVLSVEQTQTTVFLNEGKGSFSIQPLPIHAQFAPVFSIIATDMNDDGIKDLFMAGNFFGLRPQDGRFDASYGTTLLGNGKQGFTFLQPSESGLFIKGEARDVTAIKMKNGNSCIIVAMNNSPLYLFKKKKENSR